MDRRVSRVLASAPLGPTVSAGRRQSYSERSLPMEGRDSRLPKQPLDHVSFALKAHTTAVGSRAAENVILGLSRSLLFSQEPHAEGEGASLSASLAQEIRATQDVTDDGGILVAGNIVESAAQQSHVAAHGDLALGK